jgi:hypothetical protein
VPGCSALLCCLSERGRGDDRRGRPPRSAFSTTAVSVVQDVPPHRLALATWKPLRQHPENTRSRFSLEVVGACLHPQRSANNQIGDRVGFRCRVLPRIDLLATRGGYSGRRGRACQHNRSRRCLFARQQCRRKQPPTAAGRRTPGCQCTTSRSRSPRRARGSRESLVRSTANPAP